MSNHSLIHNPYLSIIWKIWLIFLISTTSKPLLTFLPKLKCLGAICGSGSVLFFLGAFLTRGFLKNFTSFTYLFGRLLILSCESKARGLVVFSYSSSITTILSKSIKKLEIIFKREIPSSIILLGMYFSLSKLLTFLVTFSPPCTFFWNFRLWCKESPGFVLSFRMFWFLLFCT